MDLDAALIRALQEDGRASIQRLAAALDQPRGAVATRLRRMLADGTVRVVAAVDPVLQGQYVLAHVSVRTAGPVRELAESLRRLDESVLVSAVGGEYDLITELRVGSMSELHDLLGRIRAMPRVSAINSLIYSEVVKGFFMTSYHGEITIDDIDLRLVEQLQRDGRATYRALGRAVSLSPSAVAVRVRRMVDAGALKVSAIEGRGLAHRQLSMGVGMNLGDSGDAVLGRLREWRGIDFMARTVGRFDAVATLVEPTAGDLFASLERLRAVPGVLRADPWLHLAVFKEDYARTFVPARTPPRGE